MVFIRDKLLMSMNKSFFVALLHIVNAYFMNSLQYSYETYDDLIYFKNHLKTLCKNKMIRGPKVAIL